MAKVLCFGDLHLKKDELRTITVINFIDDIINYCKENDIHYAVNLGDFFDTTECQSKSFVPVFNKMIELAETVKLFSIIGNHEKKDKEGNSTLVETFKAFSHFVKDYETINIEGVDCDFMSYNKDPDKIPNKGQILFGHLEVEGFYYNPNKKVDSKTFTSGMFDQYKLVVSGHLHHKQNKDNFLFVGSPYPTNKGEGGKENYFAVVDLDNLTYDLIPYNKGPDFLEIKIEDFNSNFDYKNKIVYVNITNKVENFVKLRDILIEKGALEVNPIFNKPTEVIDENTNIDVNEGIISSAVKYLSQTEETDLDKNTLLEYFKNIVSKIGEKV